MLLATVGIFYGLYKNCTYTSFAIGLAIAAILKLFVIDTWQLDLVWRIVGYIIAGILLTAMSLLWKAATAKNSKASKQRAARGNISLLYQVFYKKVGGKTVDTKTYLIK